MHTDPSAHLMRSSMPNSRCCGSAPHTSGTLCAYFWVCVCVCLSMCVVKPREHVSSNAPYLFFRKHNKKTHTHTHPRSDIYKFTPEQRRRRRRRRRPVLAMSHSTMFRIILPAHWRLECVCLCLCVFSCVCFRVFRVCRMCRNKKTKHL